MQRFTTSPEPQAKKATWGQKCWKLYVNAQDIAIIPHFKRSFLEAYSSVSFHKLPKTVNDNAYELNYYLLLLEHAVRKRLRGGEGGRDKITMTQISI